MVPARSHYRFLIGSRLQSLRQGLACAASQRSASKFKRTSPGTMSINLQAKGIFGDVDDVLFVMGAVQVLVSLHEGVYRIDDVPAKAKRVIAGA